MAIENIPVWSFEANWSSPLTEALEWLTDVLTSPKGAEQRRCLRAYPRKTLEFNCALVGNDRAFFDQFLMSHGGRNIYLPQWQESYRSIEPLSVGATAIPCPGADNGGIQVGDIVYIGNGDVRRYELAEVETTSSVGITLVAGTQFAWPEFASIHPVRKARLDDQPTLRRVTDQAVTFTVSFRIMQRNDDAGIDVGPDVTVDFLDVYGGFNVLSAPPDDREQIDIGITRTLDIIDTEVGIPLFNDVSGFPFKTQKYNWILSGRVAYSTFKKTLYHLRGRAIPLWVPTFFNDMRMVANTPAGNSSLRIDNIGFTVSGGAQIGRSHLMITRVDGTNSYHRIVGSTIDGNAEIIGLDTPFASGLNMASVLRISFMQLQRLDQDRIEISHQTDTQGVSSSSAIFRTAPDLRQVLPGF